MWTSRSFARLPSRWTVFARAASMVFNLDLSLTVHNLTSVPSLLLRLTQLVAITAEYATVAADDEAVAIRPNIAHERSRGADSTMQRK